jgi:hypothetical protein
MNYLVNGSIFKTKESLSLEVAQTDLAFKSTWNVLCDKLTHRQFVRLPVNTTYQNKLLKIKVVSKSQVVHLLVDRALQQLDSKIRAEQAYRALRRKGA